jgi:dTDP-4-dehydrorhamnose reductase
MNILVFGKDGQLGKAFHAAFDSGKIALFNLSNIQYVGRAECDLTNEQAITGWLNQFQPDLIINASAYTAVDKAETEVELAFVVNARAPEIMAQYAAKNGATFLHYSTDYVFDGDKHGFYLENDLRNPLGVYGKSKLAGEEAIAKAFAMRTTEGAGQYAIFRTSWVYGDGGNFIRTILRLAKDREELKVIEDQYGVPTSAEWLAQVSLNLVLDAQCVLRRFPSGIYHAVPAGETNWHGLASFAVQIALELGASLKLAPKTIRPIPAAEYPLPAPRPMNSRMSTDKMRQVFESRGDMSKLQQFNQPWDQAVRSYIRALLKDRLI